MLASLTKKHTLSKERTKVDTHGGPSHVQAKPVPHLPRDASRVQFPERGQTQGNGSRLSDDKARGARVQNHVAPTVFAIDQGPHQQVAADGAPHLQAFAFVCCINHAVLYECAKARNVTLECKMLR
eukprot:scaffold315880_cov13-Tisochrysis_lutea.AAC.1